MDSPGVTYRIHYLLDQSDKSQIVHYNRLRPYHAPVPDCGHETPTCDFLQSQLPHLTALSGALPFKPSKVAATKSYTLSGQGNTPSLVPPTGHPQPRPQPQSRSPLTQSCSVPSFGSVGQFDTVPSSTPQAPGSLLRPGKRPVRLPRFLKDYVLN